jgi:hypothetical protein
VPDEVRWQRCNRLASLMHELPITFDRSLGNSPLSGKTRPNTIRPHDGNLQR